MHTPNIERVAMYRKWVERFLKYFSLWGFHVVPTLKFGGDITSALIFVFHFGLSSWCSYTAYNQFAKKLALMEFIDMLNFCLYFITCSSLYWFIIFDSYTKKREQKHFWIIYQRANEKSQLSVKKGKYAAVLIMLIMADLLSCILALIHENETDVGRIMHFTFLTVVDHRVFFYILHLKVIAFQLGKIKTEINQELQSNRLLFIRNQYEHAFEMSDHVNKIFGISHLVLIMLTFHSSITYLNFIYRLLQRKFNKYNNGLKLCKFSFEKLQVSS